MQTDLKFFGIPALDFMFLTLCFVLALDSLVNIIKFLRIKGKQK